MGGLRPRLVRPDREPVQRRRPEPKCTGFCLALREEGVSELRQIIHLTGAASDSMG